MELFSNLNSPDDILNVQKVEILQKFTAELYGFKNCKNINTVPLDIFHKLYTKKQGSSNFFTKIKNFDPSLIPPCFKSLKQKILRSIFVTSMWQNATEKNCIKMNAENCGWKIVNGNLEPFWFEGECY